jgi:nitrite reductase/ring-hydroxylating ferredoxin subunit
MTMKRGRGSFQSESGGGNQNVQSMRGDTGSTSSSKIWVPVSGLKNVKDLPTEQGKAVLVDTMADALMNSATNPTGAVAVVKYGSNTYCVSSFCASCKIPLTKAQVLEPSDETGKDPRLACDFCSATYNLRTGERVTNVKASGLLGGIVKGLFSSQEGGPLPVHELGEAKGNVVINLG